MFLKILVWAFVLLFANCSFAQKGYAFLIGANKIGKYTTRYSASSVANADKDAESIKKILLKSGFQNSNITMLTGEAATSEKIIRQLKWYTENLLPGDLFVLYFSGHGEKLDDLNKDEEDFLFDQAFVTYSDYVVDDTLNHHFKKMKKGVKNIFLSDACYSGNMFEIMIRLFNYTYMQTESVTANSYVCDPVKKKHPFYMYYMGACEKTSTTIPLPDGSGKFTKRLTSNYEYLELNNLLKNTTIFNFLSGLCSLNDNNKLVIITPDEDLFKNDYPFQLSKIK